MPASIDPIGRGLLYTAPETDGPICRYFSVVILAVGSQQPMHHAADRVVPHLGEQMNMIRHQAIRINVKGQFRFLPLEQAQKLEMVIVRLEYPLAIIATVIRW